MQTPQDRLRHHVTGAIERGEKTAIAGYTVHDTFNDRIVSNHKSLEAAARAERKFSRAVRRANGPGSYIPTQIRRDGERLTEVEQDALVDIWINLDNG